MTQYTVASLWIGPELSWLEQVCLMSYLRHDHRTILYSYEPVKGVPDGVEQRDAREIMPESAIIYHKKTGSPAFHSDIFRLRMLATTDYLWIDTDALCLKPFMRADHGYFFGWGSDERRILFTGVLGLPHDSETLKGMLELTSDEYPIPPWAPKGRQNKLRALKDAGEGVHMSEMQWGICGPEALNYFAQETGEDRYAFEGEVLYPVPFERTKVFYWTRLLEKAQGLVTDEALSVHFYGRRFRNIFSHTLGIPPEGSYCDLLLKDYGIDPAATSHMFPPKKKKRADAAKNA